MKSKILIFFLLIAISASFCLAEVLLPGTTCYYEGEATRSLENYFSQSWYRDNDNVDGHWEQCWGKAFVQECWCETCIDGGFSCYSQSDSLATIRCEWGCEDGRCLRDRIEAKLPPLGNNECLDMDDEGYEPGNCQDGGYLWNTQTLAMSKQFGNKWDYCKDGYEYEAYCAGNMALQKKSWCPCGCDEDLVNCAVCDTTTDGCCVNPLTAGCRPTVIEDCCPVKSGAYSPGPEAPNTQGDCLSGEWFFEFEGNSKYGRDQACLAMLDYKDAYGESFPHSDQCEQGFCCHGNLDGTIDGKQEYSSKCLGSYNWWVAFDEMESSCNLLPQTTIEMEDCCAQYLKNVPVYERTGNPETVGDNDNDGHLEDDNCPDDYNPNQRNADDDSMGDVCDPCPENPDETLKAGNCLVGLVASGNNHKDEAGAQNSGEKDNGALTGAILGALVLVAILAVLVGFGLALPAGIAGIVVWIIVAGIGAIFGAIIGGAI